MTIDDDAGVRHAQRAARLPAARDERERRRRVVAHLGQHGVDRSRRRALQHRDHDPGRDRDVAGDRQRRRTSTATRRRSRRASCRARSPRSSTRRRSTSPGVSLPTANGGLSGATVRIFIGDTTEFRTIASNTGTRITFDSDWTLAVGTQFSIVDIVGVVPATVFTLVADNDTPGVLVTQSDGSTRVSESGIVDSYTVVLTADPGAQTITVTMRSLATETYNPAEGDAGYRNVPQVWLSLTPGGAPPACLGLPGCDLSIRLTFDAAHPWNVAQTVYVHAIDDTFVDGSDLQSFADSAQRVYLLQGPLSVDGGIDTHADRTIPPPVLLPGETTSDFHQPTSPSIDVIEDRQVDTLNVFNGDSVSADTGLLTSTRLTGLGLAPDQFAGGRFLLGGIDYAGARGAQHPPRVRRRHLHRRQHAHRHDGDHRRRRQRRLPDPHHRRAHGHQRQRRQRRVPDRHARADTRRHARLARRPARHRRRRRPRHGDGRRQRRSSGQRQPRHAHADDDHRARDGVDEHRPALLAHDRRHDHRGDLPRHRRRRHEAPDAARRLLGRAVAGRAAVAPVPGAAGCDPAGRSRAAASPAATASSTRGAPRACSSGSTAATS